MSKHLDKKLNKRCSCCLQEIPFFYGQPEVEDRTARVLGNLMIFNLCRMCTVLEENQVTEMQTKLRIARNLEAFAIKTVIRRQIQEGAYAIDCKTLKAFEDFRQKVFADPSKIEIILPTRKASKL